MIILFEDSKVRDLMPLTGIRPVYQLRCGIVTLEEKVARHYPGEIIVLHTRQYLDRVAREKNSGRGVNEAKGGKGLFVNGRVVMTADLRKAIAVDGEDTVWKSGDAVVAARLSGENFAAVAGRLKSDALSFDGVKAKTVEQTAVVIDWPWNLIQQNVAELQSDFKALAPTPARRGKVYPGVHLLDEANIHIEEGASVKPGVVLDAEGGPIFIGKGAKIFPNAVIEGPCAIGDGTAIKIMAKIYEGTTIGPTCKVGGEVEGSIIHGFSNKQHDGFLGHAYVAEWVNLGADTNNSDLKNNYGNVSVFINGEEVDSGSMFVGLTIGDHSKAGINTMFNTGTVVGSFCNVYGAGFPDKFVPDFSWGGMKGDTVVHKPEKAIAVAEKVMGRRKIKLSDGERELYHALFKMTQGLRDKAKVK